ncbi:MAG: hypothetical protein U0168_24465 [Nannocystaceae bacterium]
MGDDARARLSAGLQASGAAIAQDTLQRAVPWIERFEAQWREARTAVCERGELEASWDAETTRARGSASTSAATSSRRCCRRSNTPTPRCSRGWSRRSRA